MMRQTIFRSYMGVSSTVVYINDYDSGRFDGVDPSSAGGKASCMQRKKNLFNINSI